jgi:PAS domain S-box-containing protein
MKMVKILLVEDERIEAMDIKQTLESFGYEVPYVTSSGEDAIKKAPAILPDLILMDIILNGKIDGIQVANEIEKLDIPVIYLTAHTEESTVQKAKLTDPYGYIIKPYEQKDLKNAIDIAIYKHDLESILKASEKNYRDLVDNSLVGVYKTNFKGDILFANQAMADITHLKSVEELKSKNIRQFYKNPADRNKIINKLKKNGIINQYELDMVSATGETINVLISVHLANNTALGMVINITERKKTEKKLQRSEEFLRNIVENIPNTIFIKSADKLDFKMVNKAAENLFEHSREELIGKTDFDFFPKNEADFFIQKDREVLKNKKLLDIPEETLLTKNSGQRILHTKKIPILNKEGNPQYLLGVSEDITEHKKTVEQLKKSLNEKDVLLREIHHRVKNNLQIIASLLHLQEVSSCEEKGMAKVLKESGGRVKSMAMVHEKLFQSSNFTDFNFKQYVEKLVYDILYNYGIEIGNIKVEMDIEDITTNMDTAMPLGLIINELITNIAEYAFPKLEGTITIKLKSLPQQMELTIADDGIGIPEDIDLENPETLGLQLVTILLGQIDGEIKLDRNHGTKFKITFKELKYKERS